MIMMPVCRFTLLHFFRGATLPVLSVLLILFTMIAGWNQVQRQASRWKAYQAASKTVRTSWENQGPQNPHSSAHFGHYAFLPVSSMQAVDPGVVRFTGTMLRLEGHVQHEPVFSAASEQGVMSRFPEISLAWMVQTILPLFIVLLGFGLVAAEREQQTWKWQILQGASVRSLLLGKLLALTLVSQAWLLFAFGAQVCLQALWGSGDQVGVFGLSSLAWWITQAVYVQVVVTLTLLVSMWSRTAKQSLLISLAIWLFWVVLIPRIAADWSAKQFPLPTRVMFNRQLAEDRKKGINGHDPEDERARRFEDSLLNVYGVDSLHQLPINADGLIMQADELYSNQVYDHHFKRVRTSLLQQLSLQRWFACASPLVAAQQLSMGLAGTDVHAYLQFTRTAEDYRRYLIETLNLKMAYGGSKTGDWEWTVDEDYFKSLRDYQYTPLRLSQVVQLYQRDLFILIGWLLVFMAAVLHSVRRMPLV